MMYVAGGIVLLWIWAVIGAMFLWIGVQAVLGIWELLQAKKQEMPTLESRGIMKIYHVYATGSCDGSLCYGVCALNRSDAATLVQQRISSDGEVGGKIRSVHHVGDNTGTWEYGTVLCYGEEN